MNMSMSMVGLDEKLVLVCLLIGTGKKENPFVVTAAKQELVGELKKAVLKEKPRTFENIEADELTLYRCKSTQPFDAVMLQKLEKAMPNTLLQLQMSNILEEMTVVSKLRKYFECEPEDERIHVLVKLPIPSALKSAKAKPMNNTSTGVMAENKKMMMPGMSIFFFFPPLLGNFFFLLLSFCCINLN